mgnify:CR=1 FL=1
MAGWVVEGFSHGLDRSPYVVFSVDFASHREYLPGNDLRHLNWKIYGRQDKLYIKQYDAETNVDLHLVLDISGSMTVGDRRGGDGTGGCVAWAAWSKAEVGRQGPGRRRGSGGTSTERGVARRATVRHGRHKQSGAGWRAAPAGNRDRSLR